MTDYTITKDTTASTKPENTHKMGIHHPQSIRLAPIPRVLTKKAIRAYFNLSRSSFKNLVNDRIITAMGINQDEHRYIKEYDSDQTRVLIEELALTEEELRSMAAYM